MNFLRSIKHCFIVLVSLMYGCEKDEGFTSIENELALQAVSGTYSGTLLWRKDNPTTGETEQGTDASASIEVKRTGDDQVTFYLTTGAILSNMVINSKLISKMETGSGASYTGQFIFQHGDPGLSVSGNFGYYNRTVITIGQNARMSFTNYTKPNVIHAETLTFDGQKR